MRIDQLKLDLRGGTAVSVALTPASVPIIYIAGGKLTGGRYGWRAEEDRLLFGSKEIEPPIRGHRPSLTAIDERSFVFVGAASRNDRTNAWVIRDGIVAASFFVDGSERQVLSNGRLLVVTYAEIYQSGTDYAQEGLAAFSFGGEFLGGYRTRAGWETPNGVPIDDCYAACFDPSGRLLFSPYINFPLVRLDVETWVQEVWQLPKELHGCNEMSASDSQAFFWNPTGRRTDKVYSLDLVSFEVRETGEVPYLPYSPKNVTADGRFVVVDDDVLSIIDPKA